MAWWPVCLRKTQKSQCLIWSSKYFCVCEEKAISSCHARVAEHKLWWHIWLKICFFYACFLLIYAVAEICLTVFPYLRPFFEICGFYINFLSSLAVFAQLLSQPLPSLATQQSPMLGYEFVCVCVRVYPSDPMCVSIKMMLTFASARRSTPARSPRSVMPAWSGCWRGWPTFASSP